jgi:hypothetical protein
MPHDPVAQLAETQHHFARTIAHGPDACPPGLFAGDAAHVLRGLKVHANTISHARLVALEDTYPRTRALIGEAAFNALSHAYVDAGHGRDRSLDRMGHAFPDFLAAQAAAPLAVELARFEALWLESYHAAEATPFTAADLARLGEAGLASLCLRSHPAARLCACSAELAAALDLPDHGDAAPGRVLIARPEAQVLVHAIDAATAALFALLPAEPTFFAGLETFLVRHPNTDALATMQHLLGAGVLIEGNS